MPPKDPQDPKTGSQGSPPRRSDLYTDSVITLDPRIRERMKEAAPEVSQGNWRERAFRPRGTLSREEILEGLRQGIELVRSLKEPVTQLCTALKAEWMPYLRQAVEQAGGDGLDSTLRPMLKGAVPARKPNPRVATSTGPGQDPFVPTLLVSFERLNQTETPEALFAEAEKVVALVDVMMGRPDRRKLSFKILERELEGRLALDEVLAVLGCSNQELAARLAHVQGTIDRLREEIRTGAPGAQPTGLLWNFTRFKAERILIEAERKRRGAS